MREWKAPACTSVGVSPSFSGSGTTNGELEVRSVTLPSWPYALSPHAMRRPSVVSASVCVSPHETAATATRRRTAVGLEIAASISSTSGGAESSGSASAGAPSWPWALSPHMSSAPSARTAAEKKGPPRPPTPAGRRGAGHSTRRGGCAVNGSRLVVRGWPSWPIRPSPHERTAPDAVSSSRCSSPADSRVIGSAASWPSGQPRRAAVADEHELRPAAAAGSSRRPPRRWLPSSASTAAPRSRRTPPRRCAS